MYDPNSLLVLENLDRYVIRLNFPEAGSLNRWLSVVIVSAGVNTGY